MCPHCGCVAVYRHAKRKSKACVKQFSVTSGTMFHARKMPLRDLLVATNEEFGKRDTDYYIGTLNV